jgi:hypothetical protein
LRLLFRDNTTQDVAIPVEAWSQGERIEAVVAVGAAVIGARLWPEGIVPDWNTTNDAWGTPVPVTAVAATTGGLSGEISGRPLP